MPEVADATNSAPLLSYAELVHRLFPRLTGGIRWGLERTTALLAQAGNPQDRFWTIHVGGTNGKGSVAATIANILSAAGYRTGLYTSPHLCSFRERIRVDGIPISEGDLVATAMPLWPALESSGASFFEATTVLGLAALARANVDCAVVEVGLGGRLDSTNVITPELAIITNIAFDHAEYLGHTLEAIATEKAGIMKPGVPLVTAETQPAVLRVLEACALESRADLYACAPMALPDPSLSGNRIAVDTTCWGRLEVETPLIGRHQAQNLSLAVQSLDRIGRRFELTEAAVVRGARTVRWPGRFQVERIGMLHWVFDVAHNEAGVHALAETFNELELTRPVALLVGILGDKDWRRMLPPLFALADSIFLAVPPTAPANRAWHPEQVLAAVPARHAVAASDFQAAMAAVQRAAAPGGTVLVTGSFHTVGDALALLGISETSPDFPLHHNDFSG